MALDPTVEACALRAAQSDHASGLAHGCTNGPNRPTGGFAENVAVRWPHTLPVRDLIAAVLAGFYREGPGGGIVLANRALTVVQHFRP